jgi:CubicO group peptidase (beta-lactamase class C family)
MQVICRRLAALGAVLGLLAGVPPPLAAHGAVQDRVDLPPAVDAERLNRIDGLVQNAIASGQLPGAVVLVAHRGRTVYRRAFGLRAVRPSPEPMTVDTIFDLASLTKAIATAPSVMALVEDGAVRLRDRVSRYLPGFESHGKDAVTIEHLLAHVSGLRPDLPLEEEFEGTDEALRRTFAQRLQAPPGEAFIYSDLNFVLLGEIVRRVSGQTLDRFAAERLFRPLDMRDTRFRPSPDEVARIAPTEACTPLGWPCGGSAAAMLRGTVHDPTARRMGGVAGHAGLFGTADDLLRFGAMLLDGGRSAAGRAVLSPLTVARMTRPSTPAHVRDVRGLGWDIDSRYSSNRGDLFSPRSFGHTGFTGTSIWIDPETQTVVVFLSSRVHPDGRGDVVRLRGLVATLAAAAVGRVP